MNESYLQCIYRNVKILGVLYGNLMLALIIGFGYKKDGEMVLKTHVSTFYFVTFLKKIF